MSRGSVECANFPIIVGTFPVVALMVGNAVTRISSVESVCDSTNNSTDTDNSTRQEVSTDPCYQDGCEILAVDIAVTLSFLVGILMVNATHYALMYAEDH